MQFKTNKISKQLGFLSGNVILYLLVAASVLTIGFKLGPPYLENRSIKTALKNISKEFPKLEAATKQDVNKYLANYMMVNGIRGKGAKSWEIVRKDGAMYVNNVYEETIPIASNITVVLSFKNQLSSRNPELCCRYLVDTDVKKADASPTFP